MSFQHTARTGKTFYLHVRPGKGGRPSFHFSKDKTGPLAEAIPEGYEIYEDIRGQVFVRRRVPQVISSEELALVQEELKHRSKGHFYLAEVKKNTIVVYEAEDRTEEFLSMAMPWANRAGLAEHARESAYFQAVLRFVLEDREKRLFSAQRFCFRGSVEDWIPIGTQPETLPAVLKRFITHLGEESFFELY